MRAHGHRPAHTWSRGNNPEALFPDAMRLQRDAFGSEPPEAQEPRAHNSARPSSAAGGKQTQGACRPGNESTPPPATRDAGDWLWPRWFRPSRVPPSRPYLRAPVRAREWQPQRVGRVTPVLPDPGVPEFPVRLLHFNFRFSRGARRHWGDWRRGPRGGHLGALRGNLGCLLEGPPPESAGARVPGSAISGQASPYISFFFFLMHIILFCRLRPPRRPGGDNVAFFQSINHVLRSVWKYALAGPRSYGVPEPGIRSESQLWQLWILLTQCARLGIGSESWCCLDTTATAQHDYFKLYPLKEGGVILHSP